MNIAVFCGAHPGNDSKYVELTRQLGAWMAQHEYDLVYGGGNHGLMGVIADSVMANGGRVTGVIPQFLVEREAAKQDITSLTIVNDMHERKRLMIESSQAFIALPGGPGTMEEITEVISWARIGEVTQPCVLINITGFYNHLKAQYEEMVADGFLSQSFLDAVLFADSFDQIQPFIENYTQPEMRVYHAD